MFFSNYRPDLDHVLMRWTPNDPWPVAHACQNMLIFGKTGSGKSSGPGDAVLRAILRYANSAGLIIAAKAEDRAYICRVFREAGRLDDLTIMEPGGSHRFNVMQHLLNTNADARELAQAYMQFSETIQRTEGTGGGNASYFAAQQRRMLQNAIEILIRATGSCDPWALQCFITGAALSPPELKDDEWMKGYHNAMLEEARANATTDIQKHDFELAYQFWTSEMPRLNDRTRTSIEAGALGTLHALNTGIARDLLATTTTISPAMLEQRKWWLVQMPITHGDVTSAVVNAAVKFAVQRHVLKRIATGSDPLICLFSDEFQKVCSSDDTRFLSECRSHKGCVIALTQSMHALYAALHGKEGEHQTDAMLTNFSYLLATTLGDSKSATQAASILGTRRELFISVTLQPRDEQLYDVLMGRSLASVNSSEKYEPVLQPTVFLRGLRSGGKESGYWVDCVVLRSGTPFNATGENFLIVSFKQR